MNFLKLAAICLLSLCATTAMAQLQWAQQGHGHEAYGLYITIDQDGFIYTTGKYSDSITLGSQVKQHIGCFAAKYNKNGVIQNTIQFPYPQISGYIDPHSLNACEDKRIYFSASTDFDEWIICMDSAFNQLWHSETTASPYYTIGTKDGRVFTCGMASGPIANFDTFQFKSADYQHSNFFIGEIDSIHHARWGKQSWGGKNVFLGKPAIMKKDDQLYVLVSGDTCMSFDTLNQCPASHFTTFFMALDKNGRFLRHLTTEANIGGFAISGSGACLVAGFFDKNVILANDTLLHPAATGSDMFIAKLDSDLHVSWSKVFSCDNLVGPTKVITDQNGHLIVLGLLKGSAKLDSFTLTSTQTDINKYDPFLAKFDSTGKCVAAIVLPYADYHDFAVDQEGSTYLTGSFDGTLHLGSNYLRTTYQQGSDYFIAKIANINGVQSDHKSISEPLRIYANPNHGSFKIELPDALKLSPQANIEITDVQGKTVKQWSIAEDAVNLGTISKGIYTITITQGDTRYSGQVVVE
ncbi:MAG: T9SS type A sorting domain-containing protein [Chitinophagales bacterium]